MRTATLLRQLCVFFVSMCCVASFSIPIEIDGQIQELHFSAHDDAVALAHSFCTRHNLQGDCGVLVETVSQMQKPAHSAGVGTELGAVADTPEADTPEADTSEALVDSLFVHANELFAIDIHAAIRKYKQVIAHRPQHLDAAFNLAVSLHQTGDLGGAIRHYQFATSVAPGWADAFYNMGLVLMQQADAGIDTSVSMARSLQSFERASLLAPAHRGALQNYGTLLRQLGRSIEAEAVFRKTVSAHPQVIKKNICAKLHRICLILSRDIDHSFSGHKVARESGRGATAARSTG